MCVLWWKHFAGLWWETEEALLAGEDAEPMPQGVQGTLGNSSTSEYSCHYRSISSSDSLTNYRPWNTDQKKGFVTLNPFHVTANCWIRAVEQGLGSSGEPSPAGRWDSGHSLWEENLEQCVCLITGPSHLLILNSGSWDSQQGCPPAVLHGSSVSSLAALGKGLFLAVLKTDPGAQGHV